MLLKLLIEAAPEDLIQGLGLKAAFKRMQDPNNPEKTGNSGNKSLPARSGNQDTPLTPRLRKFFNAPQGATQGKIGFGDVDDAESRRALPIGNSPVQDEYPIEQPDMLQNKVQKKARSVFGKDVSHGQPPKIYP